MVQNTLFDQMFEPWFVVQKNLSEVERWGPYLDNNKNLRKQSVLHHQYSICFLLVPVLSELRDYYPGLDSDLVKDAFMLHDIAEGLLGLKQDIPSTKKQNHHDIDEYHAFVELFHRRIGFEHMHRAYLLQFGSKSKEVISLLPASAQVIVASLQRSRPYEVAFFAAFEHFEYLFYAYECYKNHGDELILANVLRNQVPRLIKHAQSIHGFREVLFPKHFEESALDLIEKFKHLPVYP